MRLKQFELETGLYTIIINEGIHQLSVWLHISNEPSRRTIQTRIKMGANWQTKSITVKWMWIRCPLFFFKFFLWTLFCISSSFQMMKQHFWVWLWIHIISFNHPLLYKSHHIQQLERASKAQIISLFSPLIQWNRKWSCYSVNTQWIYMRHNLRLFATVAGFNTSNSSKNSSEKNVKQSH